jgi:hypothetical protein
MLPDSACRTARHHPLRQPNNAGRTAYAHQAQTRTRRCGAPVLVQPVADGFGVRAAKCGHPAGDLAGDVLVGQADLGEDLPA